MSRTLLLFLAFLLLVAGASSSQRRTLRLQAEAVIQLPEHPVDPRDCTVQQGSRLLQPGIDYRLDAMTSATLGIKYGVALTSNMDLRLRAEYLDQAFSTADYEKNTAVVFQTSLKYRF